MAVEASGLSMLLDTVGSQLEAAANNRAQLRGYGPALQATGVPVQIPGPTLFQSLFGVGMDGTSAPDASANAPRFLSRLIGGGSGNSEASAAGMPLARMSPAAGAAAPTPVSRIPTSSGGDGQAADPASSGNSLVQLVGTTAQKYGIDPMTAVRVAMAEGGRSGGYGPNGVGDNGTSFSPFQLHYGGGMGDDFTKATGLDAADPKNMPAAVDYALSRAAKEGWGAFHGAAKVGIGAFQGIGGAQQQNGSVIPVAPASTLPGGLTPAALGAMIQEPATRAQGLALWEQMLAPKSAQFAKPGDMAFVNGRPTYQVPYAPMDVAPGNTLVDPNGGRTIAAAPPKLEHTEIGRDAFGQPTFGSFNPQSGTVAPFPGAPGIVPDGSSTAGTQGQPTGQAYLDTLPPAMGNQVKAIAEGRMTLPSGMGANSPLAQRLRAGVLQYDPKFDTTDVEARAKTRADYASGNTAQAITAGNTAIQHLGELSDAAEALQNSRFPLANAVGQAVGNATGGNLPGVAFNNILGKYVEEATKFYRGSGGTEADIQRDIGNLSPTMSPDQLRAALQAQSGLLRGKVTALQSRWRQGMGPLAGDYPIIAPPSAAVLSRIEGRPPKMSSYGGLGAAQAALPTAAPAAGQGGMPTLSDPAQVRQLASGTRFRTPDGRVGVAP